MKLSPEELEVSESDETTLDERAASPFMMNSNTKYFIREQQLFRSTQ